MYKGMHKGKMPFSGVGKKAKVPSKLTDNLMTNLASGAMKTGDRALDLTKKSGIRVGGRKLT